MPCKLGGRKYIIENVASKCCTKAVFVQLLIYNLFLETAIQLFLQAFANGLKKHMIKFELWRTFFIFLMNEYSGFSFELNIEFSHFLARINEQNDCLKRIGQGYLPLP